MEKFLSILRISLAVLGGWFVVVLWFLLLTVSKSPLNQLLVNIGIIPLMTHSNVGGIISIDHFLLMLQSALVFSSGGFVTAFFSRDQELTACSILSILVILTCIIWDSYYDCRVYYAFDLLIWFNGFLSIMLSGFIIVRMRLIKYILHRLTKRSPIKAPVQVPLKKTWQTK